MIKAELDTLVKAHVLCVSHHKAFYDKEFNESEKLSLTSLAEKGLVRFTAYSKDVVTTKGGKDLLLDKYHIQTIEELAKRYERLAHSAIYRQDEGLREEIKRIINKLPVSKLGELITSEYPYVRKRVKVRMANAILETMDVQKDKRLTRALLALGDATIEAALIEGLVLTMESAEAQWRKDLLSLDTAELVDRHMQVCLELNGSFTKQITLLQRAFRGVAEEFLKGKEELDGTR